MSLITVTTSIGCGALSVSQKVAEGLKLELYDLVINVDKLGVDAAAEMIVNLADTEHIHECSLSALESME